MKDRGQNHSRNSRDNDREIPKEFRQKFFGTNFFQVVTIITYSYGKISIVNYKIKHCRPILYENYIGFMILYTEIFYNFHI